jgi:hypothetical protein
VTDDQISILDFLSDDHFALWDFAHSFPAMRPDSDGNQTALLLDLVGRGFVEVTFGRWFENDTTPVSVENARAVLFDTDCWKTTGRQPGYAIEVTQAGRDILRQRGIGHPD